MTAVLLYYDSSSDFVQVVACNLLCILFCSHISSSCNLENITQFNLKDMLLKFCQNSNLPYMCSSPWKIKSVFIAFVE